MMPTKRTLTGRSHAVRDPIYRVDWYFISSSPAKIVPTLAKVRWPGGLKATDRAWLLNEVSREFAGAEDSSGRCMVNNGIVVIWTELGADWPVACHECVHGAHAILGARGIELTPSSDEAFAYYVEWACNEWKRVGGR